MLPNLPKDHPHAKIHNSFDSTKLHDSQFASDCAKTFASVFDLPYTTRNILWYDVNTSRVKIATHARFDEGMNDLTIDAIPHNVQHLQRAEEGLPIEPDVKPIGVEDFCFHITPFAKLLLKSVVPSKTLL